MSSEQDSPAAEEAKAPANRRGHPRLAVDCAVVARPVQGGVPVSGRLTSLSMSGCCILAEGRTPLELLTRVEVEFELRGIPLRLLGVCQGSRGGKSFAVRFLDLSERRKSQLFELLAELREAEASAAQLPETQAPEAQVQAPTPHQ